MAVPLALFPGIGTAVNVATVLIGSSLGLLLGARLPTRTRDTVTDALGLVTLLIGALSAAQVGSAALAAAVGSSAPVLIVLGALLLGGIAGSLLDIEAGCERGCRDAAPYGVTLQRERLHPRTRLQIFPRDRSPQIWLTASKRLGSASSKDLSPPR
jgi:hypothetical protein